MHQGRARKAAVAAAAAILVLTAGTGVASATLAPTSLAGDDVFYTPPSQLPDGKPGDVLKTEDLPLSLDSDGRVQRIMYLSTDTRGKLVPVTGLLLTPLLQKPGNANPLVVHTPGTRGLGDDCSPSRQADLLTADSLSPDYSLAEYHQFLVDGISVVVTDYEGEGTPGDPSYLVGESEGRNGLDALRAAERVSGSGVSVDSPVGISGYSQGGQAAAWAAELQPAYAPEQNLKGVLAGGTPTDMLVEVNHLNGDPIGAGLALASLVGLDHANPGLDLDGKLTPEGKQLVDQVRQSCYVEDVAAFKTVTVGQVTSPDVLADPAWQKAYRASLLGTKKPGAPAYLYHGTLDTLVPIAQEDLLYHGWCGHGTSVQYQEMPGLEHLSNYFVGSVQGIQWLTDRLGGAPAAAGCSQAVLP